MTKKCSGCYTEMFSGFKAKLDNSPLANFIVCSKGKSMKIDVYICPNCGKVEFYTHDSDVKSKKEG